ANITPTKASLKTPSTPASPNCWPLCRPPAKRWRWPPASRNRSRGASWRILRWTAAAPPSAGPPSTRPAPTKATSSPTPCKRWGRPARARPSWSATANKMCGARPKTACPASARCTATVRPKNSPPPARWHWPAPWPICTRCFCNTKGRSAPSKKKEDPSAMTFPEMPYQRPDLAALKADYDAITARLRAAADYPAARAAFLENDALERHIQTLATLASTRHSIDTRDAFYDGESKFWNAADPELQVCRDAFIAVLLESPFRADF